jgi:phosphoribosyl-ATP pyrophosphohydrolase
VIVLEDVFDEVFMVLEDRKRNPRSGSYVSGLMGEGLNAILMKVEEESGELVLAAKDRDRSGTIHEAADLLFHTLVLLAYQSIGLEEVRAELRRRRQG